MAAVETVLLYVILGAVLGIVWSLRKIYVLEARLVALDLKTEKLVENLVKKKK
ncbi:hypothetical protein J4216_01340 [Candidatus Woesearchaeota archaeon]|nr:hypothetical protein [Candidatus Woesearchaeota archaeon]